MNRKLIVFGNGLGMALDHNHFSLEKALDEIWNTQGFLTDVQKKLISKCTGRNNHPSGEKDLDKLHLAVNSCQTLNRIASGKTHWLSNDGKDFPDITANYIQKLQHNYTTTQNHYQLTLLVH